MDIEPGRSASTDPTTQAAPETRPPAGPTNGFAVASLVLGIVGLTAFPVIPSLLALIFGYKAKAEIDRSGGYEQGRGMAIAGIVLGWVAVVLALLFIGLALAAVVIGISSSGGFDQIWRMGL